MSGCESCEPVGCARGFILGTDKSNRNKQARELASKYLCPCYSVNHHSRDSINLIDLATFCARSALDARTFRFSSSDCGHNGVHSNGAHGVGSNVGDGCAISLAHKRDYVRCLRAVDWPSIIISVCPWPICQSVCIEACIHTTK